MLNSKCFIFSPHTKIILTSVCIHIRTPMNRVHITFPVSGLPAQRPLKGFAGGIRVVLWWTQMFMEMCFRTLKIRYDIRANCKKLQPLTRTSRPIVKLNWIGLFSIMYVVMCIRIGLMVCKVCLTLNYVPNIKDLYRTKTPSFWSVLSFSIHDVFMYYCTRVKTSWIQLQ